MPASIKVQRGQADVSANGTTITIPEAVGSLDSAFVILAQNRHQSNGSASSTGNMEGDDLSLAVRLTDTSTITCYRPTTTPGNAARVEWVVVEYVGPAGGDNEFIVRDRVSTTISNGTTTEVDVPIANVANKDRVIPFIQGQLTTDTNNGSNCLAWCLRLSSATNLKAEHGNGQASNEDKTVYGVMVEFTGSAWTVAHAYETLSVMGDTGDIVMRTDSMGEAGTIFDAGTVTEWATTMVAAWGHTMYSGDDGIEDLWPFIRPDNQDSDRVYYEWYSGHPNTQQSVVMHMLNHADLGVTWIVEDLDDLAITIDITAAGLTDLERSMILGTSISTGSGTAYARGWRAYRLLSLTSAECYAHRTGNGLTHRIQIIDFAGIQHTAGPSFEALVWDGAQLVAADVLMWDGTQLVAAGPVLGE